MKELGYPKTKLEKEGLDAIIGLESEGLSIGQQQAICLVREILSRKQIVVLDEVTSNFDAEGERRFKEVFFREFKGSTIMIISHRLDTVLHCDKVMVMDQGKILEFDSPNKLLEDTQSAFYGLAHTSKI